MNFFMERLRFEAALRCKSVTLMPAARFSSRTSPRRNVGGQDMRASLAPIGNRRETPPSASRCRRLPRLHHLGDDISAAIGQTRDLRRKVGDGMRSRGMTSKLLAHILRGSSLAADAQSTARPLDFGRWVIEALVVRRWEPIGWRRQRPPPRRATPPRADAANGDATWTDTQPWCHE